MRLAIVAHIAFHLIACTRGDPYVVLTIADPAGVATGFASLHVGPSRDLMREARGDKARFPVTMTVVGSKVGEQTVWVEARAADGTPLGRGNVVARFKKRGKPTADVFLTRVCDDASQACQAVPVALRNAILGESLVGIPDGQGRVGLSYEVNESLPLVSPGEAGAVVGVGAWLDLSGRRVAAVDCVATALAPGIAVTCELPYEASDPEGQHPVVIRALDAAGHQDEITLWLEIDLTAPGPLTAVQLHNFLYVRKPWGDRDGGPQFTIEWVTPAPVALANDATAFFWDGADLAVALEIGQQRIDANGDLPVVTLNQRDRAEVYVRLVDDAGNTSGPPQRIPETLWVATLAGKVAGSDAENPHGVLTCQSLAGSAGTSELCGEPSQARLDAVGALDDVALVHTPLPGRVRQIDDDAPPAIARAGLAFDTTRGALVLMHVVHPEVHLWERTDGLWRLVSQWDPATGQGPRVVGWGGIAGPEGSATIVYASHLQRTVFFGGTTGDQTWLWDGEQWEHVTTSDPEDDDDPSPRKWHALAYDPANRRVVLFGGEASLSNRGYNGSGWVALGDTWSFDGESWAKIVEADPTDTFAPEPRRFPQMVYDSRRARLILHGGGNSLGESVKIDGGTWALEGATYTRLSLSPGAPQRIAHVLAYDGLRDRVVMHGGMDAIASIVHGAPREMSPTGWETVTDPNLGSYCSFGDQAPGCRTGSAATFDPLRQRVVMVGPSLNGDENDGIFEWDGGEWQRHRRPYGASDPPSPRASPLVTDAERGELLFYGGQTSGPGCTDGTWTWDGVQWVRADADPSAPGPRLTQLAFDPISRNVYMAGGRVYGQSNAACVDDGDHGLGCDDTWMWNGSAWTEVTISDTEGDGEPPPRVSAGFVYDPNSGEVLLHGGDDDLSKAYNDTWLFDGSRWLDVSGTTDGVDRPTPRFRAAVGAGPSGPVVLYGGLDSSAGAVLDDTWLWNGTTWSLATVTDSEDDGNPGARLNATMVWSPEVSALLLFGGVDNWVVPAPSFDVWAWTGSSWALLASEPLDAAGLSAVVVEPGVGYDPISDRLLMQGGMTHDFRVGAAGAEHPRVFDLQSSGWPAELFRFSVLPGESLGDKSLRSLQIDLVGGGRGVDGPGARLMVATPAGWIEYDANSASPDAPAALNWTSDGVPTANLAMIEDDVLSCAVRSLSAGGAGGTEVAVDHVQLQVRYRSQAPP